jgi:hypothetical protein
MLQLDAMMFSISETKLSSRIKIDALSTLQTQLDRKGGSILMSRGPSFKAIKALSNSIAWAIVAIENVPIHFINVYLTP